MRHALKLSAFIALGASLLAAPATANKPKCFPRRGHCVAVAVNQQASVELSKRTRKILRELEAVHHSVDDTLYELVDPIRGEIDLRADRVAGSQSWFGAARSVDAKVVALSQVELETHRERAVTESVRIGGSAAVGEASVLNENRLPQGPYLLIVTLRGESNWDRQILYFVVEADP